MKKTIVIMAVILVGFTGLDYLGIDFVCDVKAEQKATKCVTCSGTGKCVLCGGAGKASSSVDNKGNRNKCDSCSGNGKCTSCGGSGTVWSNGNTSGGASTAPTR